jgi:hypothetical protein
MHPITAQVKKAAKRCPISLHELLRKIKRFNPVVKHYFLGHYSVALLPDQAHANSVSRTIAL